MRSRSPVLTEQELEIMKVVWELGEPTVRDVYERLRERRKIAYTTVMTMMNVLVEKNRLNRRMVDRAYVYQPAEQREKVVGSMVKDFLGRVFDGSAKPLLVQLVEQGAVSEGDLEEAQRLIREAEAGEGKER